MDKAKAAVSSFLSKDGKHTTEVHESVNPAVQQEHITPTRHENVTTAVDREVHQDHYHTSVQPIKDREVLPEQHSHNVAPTQHKETHHGNSAGIKEKAAAEAAQFKSTREVGHTQHTQSAAPTVGGEHIHHHVHENIQPVIQKETIQPSVVHTTIPVHETHHNEAKHHAATTLPTVSMSEFNKTGGSLTGRDTRTDHFEGQPKGTIGSVTGSSGHPTIGGHGAAGTTHLTERDGKHTGTGLTGSHGTTTGSGLDSHTSHGNHSLTGTGAGVGAGAAAGAGVAGTHGTHNTTSTTGNVPSNLRELTGRDPSDPHGPKVAGGLTGASGSHGTHDTTHKKPSLMDKINPKVDADGDGKAGFMK